MTGKIGLFDSGIGGLSILKKLIEVLPKEDYIFYEDSINNPYGEKSDDELLNISSKIVDFLLENDSKIIIIACNTATTSCINKLRKLYPDVIFVGTVPAVKKAYDNYNMNTCILSTNYTRNSVVLNNLINQYKRENQNIYNISGRNLANLIELDDKSNINKLLIDIITPYKDKIDSLVLGCTHYSLIKDEICDIVPNVDIYESVDDVVEQVKYYLLKYDLLNKVNKCGSVEIINTKDEKIVERSIKILNL